MLRSLLLEKNILLEYSLIFENLKQQYSLEDTLFFDFPKKNYLYLFTQRKKKKYFSLLKHTNEGKKKAECFSNGFIFSIPSKILSRADFKIENTKGTALKIFEHFAEILEKFLENKRGQITVITEYFFKSKKNRKNFHDLINLQLIALKGTHFNNPPSIYHKEKTIECIKEKSSCEFLEISKIFLKKKKKMHTERKLVKNSLSIFPKIKKFWVLPFFFCNNTIFGNKRALNTLYENFFEENFFPIRLVSFLFLKKRRLIFLESFGKIFNTGLSIISKFSSMNEYGLKRFSEKKTRLNQFVKTFFLDIKKASLMLSFETNSDMLRGFLKNHLFSICPVEKDQAILLSALLPCGHLISNTTNEELIKYFSIEQKTEKPFLICPCCQVSFPGFSDKKMIFD